MAEVQRSTAQGELTARFIEFVRMHAHNTSLCLGTLPHAASGQRQANLEVARMLVEQLASIAARTSGNLSVAEEEVLKSTLSGLEQTLARALEATRRGEPWPPPQS